MKKLLSMQLLALVLSGAAVAQVQLNVPATLVAGQKITISYTNPSLANSTVTVWIDDGNAPNPQETQVQIQLDANGTGEVKWLVPNWDTAAFNAPGVREVACFIEGAIDWLGPCAVLLQQ